MKFRIVPFSLHDNYAPPGEEAKYTEYFNLEKKTFLGWKYVAGSSNREFLEKTAAFLNKAPEKL